MRTIMEAAADLLAADEFTTNVRCLNALYGVQMDCAAWSRHFGGYAGAGQGEIPDGVWARVERVRAIVNAARSADCRAA